jgi:hypothetical protein
LRHFPNTFLVAGYHQDTQQLLLYKLARRKEGITVLAASEK